MAKDKEIRVRLDEETKKKLKEKAKKENRTMSGWIENKIKTSK
jgi:predicted HicB family RNase H-like nuclease